MKISFFFCIHEKQKKKQKQKNKTMLYMSSWEWLEWGLQRKRLLASALV